MRVHRVMSEPRGTEESMRFSFMIYVHDNFQTLKDDTHPKMITTRAVASQIVAHIYIVEISEAIFSRTLEVTGMIAMTPGGGHALPFYEQHKTFNVKLSRMSINIKTVCKRDTSWREMRSGIEDVQVPESRNPVCCSLQKCVCQATRDGFNLTQSESLAALEPDIWWKRWEGEREMRTDLYFFQLRNNISTHLHEPSLV